MRQVCGFARSPLVPMIAKPFLGLLKSQHSHSKNGLKRLKIGQKSYNKMSEKLEKTNKINIEASRRFAVAPMIDWTDLS